MVGDLLGPRQDFQISPRLARVDVDAGVSRSRAKSRSPFGDDNKKCGGQKQRQEDEQKQRQDDDKKQRQEQRHYCYFGVVVGALGRRAWM